MSINEEIGETILLARKQKSYSREWVALECEITTHYLADIEQGKANPTIDMLLRIAEVLALEFRNPLVVPVLV